MTDPLIIDIYEGDGNFALDKLVDAGPPWHGAMLKVSQGTYYSAPNWLGRMWPFAMRCAGERYGRDWFRLPYLFVDVGQDGAAQARFFLDQLAKVGGLGLGDPFVVLDVERGGQRHGGAYTKAQIASVGAAAASTLKQATGRKVVCYGGEFLRSNGITIDDLGCDLGWVARYAPDLPAQTYESIGCPLDRLLAWQYAGLEGGGKVDALLKDYPAVSPAGKVDISALTVAGGGDAALAYLRGACAA